ncbi:MAG: DUF3866 family protein [Coriobacteriales bacterium]|jgi:hypothetical protein|nr:DUF3866 family protein [Coriobacteriales bacterium]
MRLAAGIVQAVVETVGQRQTLVVALDEDVAPSDVSEGACTPTSTGEDPSLVVTAVNYLEIARPLRPTDRVLLNMTALDLGLGTGGIAFVVPQGAFGEKADRSDGHLMKLRYTPLQREVCAVEEPASPHHRVMREARSLAGMPVVCCGLHSQVPLVAAAVKHRMPDAHVTYCMTDEAALMLAFSELAERAVCSGLVDATVTCGQALGGVLEAVTLHSGLLAAHHVLASDVCIVGIGPGLAGSETAFGHGGIAQGEALNAVGTLQGAPVAALRVSFADGRARHLGISHHCLTALRDVCLTKAVIALPADVPPTQKAMLTAALREAGLYDKHRVLEVAVARERIDLWGLTVTTMGRTQEDDPAFFDAAFAAGLAAAELAKRRRA